MGLSLGAQEVSGRQGLSLAEVPVKTCPELTRLDSPLVLTGKSFSGLLRELGTQWLFSLEILRMTEHMFPPAFILLRHIRSFLAVTLAEKAPTSVDPRWEHLGTRGCHRPRF